MIPHRRLRLTTIEPSPLLRGAIDRDRQRSRHVGDPARRSLESPFAIGDVLARRYRLERLLGVGAMGIVFAARHAVLDHEVAIKVLRGATDEGIARFAREARTAARLADRCPYVARVFDYGVEHSLPFVVMELLRGEDLERRLRREERIDPREVLAIAEPLGEALSVAHEEGIVHRDVKPSNVFLSEIDAGGSVKLLDFGLAQWPDSGPAIVGTPGYMAPEQQRGSFVDARADVFGLAAVVHHALVGFAPGDAPRVDALPAPLADVLRRALAARRDDRFPCVATFVEALRKATPRKPALTRHASGVRRRR